jgi:hypothetical protein
VQGACVHEQAPSTSTLGSTPPRTSLACVLVHAVHCRRLLHATQCPHRVAAQRAGVRRGDGLPARGAGVAHRVGGCTPGRGSAPAHRRRGAALRARVRARVLRVLRVLLRAVRIRHLPAPFSTPARSAPHARARQPRCTRTPPRPPGAGRPAAGCDDQARQPVRERVGADDARAAARGRHARRRRAAARRERRREAARDGGRGACGWRRGRGGGLVRGAAAASGGVGLVGAVAVASPPAPPPAHPTPAHKHTHTHTHTRARARARTDARARRAWRAPPMCCCWTRRPAAWTAPARQR